MFVSKKNFLFPSIQLFINFISFHIDIFILSYNGIFFSLATSQNQFNCHVCKINKKNFLSIFCYNSTMIDGDMNTNHNNNNNGVRSTASFKSFDVPAFCKDEIWRGTLF